MAQLVVRVLSEMLLILVVGSCSALAVQNDPVANQQDQDSSIPRKVIFRKWVDDSRRYSVEAQFVEVKDDEVVLKKTNGDTITVPLRRLSKEDRRYLVSLRKKDTSPNTAAHPEKADSDPDSSTGGGVDEAAPLAAHGDGGLVSAGDGLLLKIPLIIQPSRGPGYNWKEDASIVKGALNEALDRGEEEDVVAMRDAAKVAGELAGFELEPLIVVKSGEKPMDSVRRLPDDTETFLFMRCSGIFRSLGPMGMSAIVRVDHALIQRADFEVLDAENWFTFEPGHTVPHLAKAFAEDFGWEVLVPLQQRYMKEEIDAAVNRIRATGEPRAFAPTVESTRGIAELALVFQRPGRCDLYFQKAPKTPFRKCMLVSGSKTDEFGKLPAGNWKLYAEVWPDKSSTPRRYYCDAFTAKSEERYVLELPGPGK